MSEEDRIALHTLCREMAAWLAEVEAGKRLARDERVAAWLAFFRLRDHCNALERRAELDGTDEIR